MQVSAASFALNTNYQQAKGRVEQSMQRLSSGDKFSIIGEGKGGDLSMAERFRHKYRSAAASTDGINAAIGFVQTATKDADEVTGLLQRMSEVAAAALAITDASAAGDRQRQVMQSEFAALKGEINRLSKDTSFASRQTIGRGVIAYYNSNDSKLHYTDSGSNNPGDTSADFSATALDSNQSFIGFSQNRDYGFSRDGKSLYFMGDDGAANIVLKRYDIASRTVTAGTDTFSASDRLFIDAQNNIYVNKGSSTTLFSVDSGTLKATATSVTDIAAGTAFSVQEGKVTYKQAASNLIVEQDLALGPPGNTLVNTATVGSGAYTGTGFDAGSLGQAFSADGTFVADEVSAGVIRVINTRTQQAATLNVGVDARVNQMRFDEGSSSLYYVDNISNAIKRVSVSTALSGAVSITQMSTFMQGNAGDFGGLVTTGSNPGSNQQFGLYQDGLQTINYSAIDLSTYALGLGQSNVSTATNASDALTEIEEALHRVGAASASLAGIGVPLNLMLDAQDQFVQTYRTQESNIRSVDVARESAAFAAYNVQQSAAIAILSQHSNLTNSVLRLLNAN